MINNCAYYPSNRQASYSAFWPFHSTNSPISTQRSLKSRLNTLLQTLAYQLCGSSDPYIWSTQDASGQTIWNANDRASDKIIRNASETELRSWLEKRYMF